MNLTPPDSDQNSKPAYLDYGDAIRVFAMLAVVLLHSATFGLMSSQLSLPQWWIANFFDSICRWAVPVFIMLSGALLLDPARKEPLWEFYQKKFLRIFIPLIFWSAFNFLWIYWYRKTPVAWSYIREQLAVGMTDFQLYFLVILLGLYILTPMLRVYTRHSDRRDQGTLAILFLALSCLSFFADHNYPNGFLRGFPYLGYYLMGYHLRSYRLGKIKRINTFLIFLVIALFTMLGTYYQSLKPGANLELFYEHFFPTCIAESITIFLLIASFNFSSCHRLNAFLKILAPASFGIYLTHGLILECFHNFLKDYYFHSILPAILIETVSVFSLSAVLVLLLRRFRIFRYVLG